MATALIAMVGCSSWAGGAQGSSALSLPFESTKIVKTDALGVDFAAEGPKSFPGDTRKNRVFFGQVFVVEK